MSAWSVSGIQGAGVILRNPKAETILLVQGKESKKWSFPKGEQTENETLMACATRETFEETGIGLLIPENSMCVTFGKFRKRCYFLVTPKAILSREVLQHMETHDRREIAQVQWFTVARAKRLPRNGVNRDVWTFLHEPTHIVYYQWKFPELVRLDPKKGVQPKKKATPHVASLRHPMKKKSVQKR